MVSKILAVLALFGPIFFSCQKKPDLASASDPISAMGPPPMGATTFNDELKRQIDLLDNLLNERIPQKTLEILKDTLVNGDKKALSFKKASDEAYLIKIFMLLPELIHKQGHFLEHQKNWYKAKLYFLHRRFIEAATLLTKVL